MAGQGSLVYTTLGTRCKSWVVPLQVCYYLPYSWHIFLHYVIIPIKLYIIFGSTILKPEFAVRVVSQQLCWYKSDEVCGAMYVLHTIIYCCWLGKTEFPSTNQNVCAGVVHQCYQTFIHNTYYIVIGVQFWFGWKRWRGESQGKKIEGEGVGGRERRRMKERCIHNLCLHCFLLICCWSRHRPSNDLHVAETKYFGIILIDIYVHVVSKISLR